MQRGLHGMALVPSDLLTNIEVALGAGYDVLELWAPSLVGYLDQGNSAEELGGRFGRLHPHLIAAVKDIDLPEGSDRDLMIGFTRRMCQVAQEIHCPYIQMVSGRSWESRSWPVIRRETSRSLRALAELCATYGVGVAYEPVAWLPVHSLEQALEVVGDADCPNIGLVVDTFHIYAVGERTETIQSLDPKIIATVHLGDTAPKRFDNWSDEDRHPLPGDGVIPLQRLLNAVLDTGYDGVVTDEMSSNSYTSWSRLRLATALKAKGDAILRSLGRKAMGDSESRLAT